MTRTATFALVSIVIIVLLLGGFFIYQNQSQEQAKMDQQKALDKARLDAAMKAEETVQMLKEKEQESMKSAISVILEEENNSNQSGVALLKENLDGKTVVTLTLTGFKPNVSQPAHIHEGACPKVGDVVYPLASVLDGKSETVLDAPIAALKGRALAINVHESASKINVYTACGDINPTVKAKTSPTPSPTKAPQATSSAQ